MREPVHERTALIEEADGTRWTFSTAAEMCDDMRWLLEDVSGWVSGAGVRANVTQRLRHGAFPSRAWREGRTMSLVGVVRCSSQAIADDVERAVASILWSGELGTLTVEEAAGRTLHTQVRLDGKPDVQRPTLTDVRVLVPLHAPDAFLYGPELVSYLYPIGEGIGLRYPLHQPGYLDYGAGVEANEPITNRGTAEAFGRFLVVGDFPGGFRITVGGRTVEWPWPVMRGLPVEVDMAGAVWSRSSNLTDQATLRQWSSLPSGVPVTPSFKPLQGGNGWCEVHYSDTYA